MCLCVFVCMVRSSSTGGKGWLWIFRLELLLFLSLCTLCTLHLRWVENYYYTSNSPGSLCMITGTLIHHCAHAFVHGHIDMCAMCICVWLCASSPYLYRCLWRDFLKVFKRSTKIKGLLYRYFNSYWDSTSKSLKSQEEEMVSY